MKKSVKISTNRLFSLELKKALFYSFIEAKNKKTNIINSQFLLYGILKSHNGTASKTLNKIYQSKTSFNPTSKILSSIDVEFQNNYKNRLINQENNLPNFSRPIRKLLFFLLRSSKQKKNVVITTLDVLNYLLRHKYIKNFIHECLVTT